jgi:hypothetical protein
MTTLFNDAIAPVLGMSTANQTSDAHLQQENQSRVSRFSILYAMTDLTHIGNWAKILPESAWPRRKQRQKPSFAPEDGCSLMLKRQVTGREELKLDASRRHALGF